MKARFIGKDGSLGLSYNKVYDIRIENPKDERLLISGYREFYTSKFWCPYDNLIGFLRNWHPLVLDGNLKVIDYRESSKGIF
jgi:hypothetical protein